MRLLVVEDDLRLGPGLKKGLEGDSYAVDLVTDGEDAIYMGTMKSVANCAASS